MTSTLTAVALPQPEELIAEYEDLRKRSQHNDFSEIDKVTASKISHRWPLNKE